VPAASSRHKAQKPHQPDGHAGTKVPLNYVRVDIGACKKREHNRAKAGDIVNPWRQRQADRIASDSAYYDLEQRR
jgi:hypothetical protein